MQVSAAAALAQGPLTLVVQNCQAIPGVVPSREYQQLRPGVSTNAMGSLVYMDRFGVYLRAPGLATPAVIAQSGDIVEWTDEFGPVTDNYLATFGKRVRLDSGGFAFYEAFITNDHSQVPDLTESTCGTHGSGPTIPTQYSTAIVGSGIVKGLLKNPGARRFLDNDFGSLPDFEALLATSQNNEVLLAFIDNEYPGQSTSATPSILISWESAHDGFDIYLHGPVSAPGLPSVAPENLGYYQDFFGLTQGSTVPRGIVARISENVTTTNPGSGGAGGGAGSGGVAGVSQSIDVITSHTVTPSQAGNNITFTLFDGKTIQVSAVTTVSPDDGVVAYGQVTNGGSSVIWVGQGEVVVEGGAVENRQVLVETNPKNMVSHVLLETGRPYATLGGRKIKTLGVLQSGEGECGEVSSSPLDPAFLPGLAIPPRGVAVLRASIEAVAGQSPSTSKEVILACASPACPLLLVEQGQPLPSTSTTPVVAQYLGNPVVNSRGDVFFWIQENSLTQTQTGIYRYRLPTLLGAN
jgi:hypothetical protein